MCYAIPGKVVELNDNIITVDYFGEKKKAKNDFFELVYGDYVYAQGGFVVSKISHKDAIDILKTWREYFFKLQKIDLQLSQKTKTLYQRANNIRQKYLGNACCVHGIIEFSNYCINDCLYCGLRISNKSLTRYRMSIDEIVNTCDYAVNELGFKALVLQSGEDMWYDEKKLIKMVRKIREKCAILLILSIGERELTTYKKLYSEGARGILLRFEISNSYIYKKIRPNHTLKNRVELIKSLKDIGYIIMTGFLIGLPGQSEDDISNDIKLTASLGAELFSLGPLIPHPKTPLANTTMLSLTKVLTTIAKVRISNPNAKILATTALETLDKKEGLRLALLSGANSLMINITPKKYRNLYEIYPNRAGTEIKTEKKIYEVLNLLKSIGRAPTDIGI